MDWDEARAKPKAEIEIGADLSALSLAELEARIVTLKGEIARIEQQLNAKRAHSAAASALFKS
ncbi:MAG: DUF1192 domain-containing protein [Hyphomicrobiaceae bacterium]